MRYVARRLLLFVPTLVGASILIFVLLRLVPGDIAEILVYQTGSEASAIQQKQIRQIRAELGLDRPVVVQYLDWLGGALRGDFGRSYMQKRPVADILRERVPRSLELALLTILIALVWAVPLGVVSAVRQNTWADYLVRVLSISGLSLPIFFTGVLVLYLLVRLFGWLPPLEFVSVTVSPLENLKRLIWPALVQAYYISAPITRLTRSQGMIRISTEALLASRLRIQRPMTSGTTRGYFRRYAASTACLRSGRSSTHSARPSNDGPSGAPSATRTRPVALMRRALRLALSVVK